MDPECIEEEIEDDQVQVCENEYEAVQDLFDPQSPYRCPSSETLQKARAFWIGPHNCQVNTPETDAVAKAKTEWIQVHSSPLNPLAKRHGWFEVWCFCVLGHKGIRPVQWVHIS